MWYCQWAPAGHFLMLVLARTQCCMHGFPSKQNAGWLLPDLGSEAPHI